MNRISYVQSSVCTEKLSFQRCTAALLVEELKQLLQGRFPWHFLAMNMDSKDCTETESFNIQPYLAFQK